MDELQKRRMARNEARFRDVNGSISAGIDRFASDDPDSIYTLICECALESCEVMLQVSHAEYREVRSSPVRFMVHAEHVVPGVEHVVERNERFWTIEKDGVGAAVARDLS